MKYFWKFLMGLKKNLLFFLAISFRMLKLWWSEHKMFKLVINWIFFFKAYVKQQVKSSQVQDKWKKIIFWHVLTPLLGSASLKGTKEILLWQHLFENSLSVWFHFSGLISIDKLHYFDQRLCFSQTRLP